MAVLRRQYDTVQALIEYEFPLVCKNARRWLPIDEAVALRDRRMVRVLHAAEVQTIKALHKAKRGALLQTMAKMANFTFKVGCPSVHALYSCESVHALCDSGAMQLFVIPLRCFLHSFAFKDIHTRHNCFQGKP